MNIPIENSISCHTGAMDEIVTIKTETQEKEHRRID